jgi:large subunit ribosomal protein L18
MAAQVNSKKSRRLRRHKGVRARISGTSKRPRLSVFRSLRHLQVQLIDDVTSKTLFGLSDLMIKKGTKSERAKGLGKIIAKEAQGKGIKEIVFDRGGYRYHGRVRALAEALREGGIKF